MASKKVILAALEKLEEYYKQKYNGVQAEVMCSFLAVLPEYLLTGVVERYMMTEDNWLPKGSQLLKIATQISGYDDLELVPSEERRKTLGGLHQELKNKYYQDGTFVREQWLGLIEHARSYDKVYSLAALQRSLDCIDALEAAA
uniref:Uncharacterized protein n=1 Tax=viral metagenome TaxID=1070528 RepID=A0A6M3KRW6_9ZZZZ